MNSSESQLKARSELARRELARRNLKDFVTYLEPEYLFSWHNELLIEKLEAVARGDITRLIVMMPPRSGKSLLTSVLFPSWFIGREPHEPIIASSYGSELAMDFGRQVRNTVASQEYRNIFSDAIIAQDSNAKGRWNTQQGGGYYAVGVGGALTGKGGKILLIDDPIKNRQDADSPVVREMVHSWYKSTARTRLTPDGRIVLVLTRWHDDDLAGRLLNGEVEWDIVKLKAIADEDEPPYRLKGEALWPSRFSLENLQQTRKEIGTFEFSALYQQEPLDSESQEFKKAWFQTETMAEVAKMSTRCFITIDTAVSQKDSSDYTAITINFVNNGNKWYIRTMRGKYNPTELIDILFKLHADFRPEKIGIEKTVYTMAIFPFLQDEMNKRGKWLPIVELQHNQVQKEVRIRGLIPRYENHAIFHIEGYTEELEQELLRFPKGVHDDLIDALAYQLQIAEVPTKYTITGQDEIFNKYDLFS